MQPKRVAKPSAIIEAIQAGKAAELDGLWIGACKTTRIYCRVQCPAGKHVREENVAAFASAAAAENAGFRPCLTCCPEDAALPSEQEGLSEEAVAFAKAISEGFASKSALSDFCATTQLTEAELDELVRNAFDATPQEYLETTRRLAAKRMLRTSITTVEYVAAQCGFASANALRAEFKQRYKFDADKLAAQRPRKPRLAK